MNENLYFYYSNIRRYVKIFSNTLSLLDLKYDNVWYKRIPHKVLGKETNLEKFMTKKNNNNLNSSSKLRGSKLIF